jgi:hypothetical protein
MNAPSRLICVICSRNCCIMEPSGAALHPSVVGNARGVLPARRLAPGGWWNGAHAVSSLVNHPSRPSPVSSATARRLRWEAMGRWCWRYWSAPSPTSAAATRWATPTRWRSSPRRSASWSHVEVATRRLAERRPSKHCRGSRSKASATASPGSTPTTRARAAATWCGWKTSIAVTTEHNANSGATPSQPSATVSTSSIGRASRSW